MSNQLVGNAQSSAIFRKLKERYDRILEFCERFMPALTVGALMCGVFVGKYSEHFTDIINAGVSRFVDLYGFFAPAAIFIILALSCWSRFWRLSRCLRGGRPVAERTWPTLAIRRGCSWRW